MRIPGGHRIDEASDKLLKALTSFWGIATADGNAGGTTVVCDGLANESSYAGHQAAVNTGGAWGQAMRVATHVGNTLTVANGFTDLAGAPAPVLAGTVFVVLKESWGLDFAALTTLLNAFSILQGTGGILLPAGVGENDVMLVDGPAGIFWPHKIQIDLGLMVAGDNTIIREYYRIALAGALLLKDQVTYNGIQVPRLINVELEPNRFGFWVSLAQTAAGAGGNKNYAWAYFFED